MKQESDPRVFFAAERTMLAWLRTGIATIGLGFLVARFGYFMMVMQGSTPRSDLTSKLIGIGLVVLGTTMIGLSGWQHRRFLSVLQSESLPPQYSARLSLVLAALMCLCGIALVFYLASASKGTQRIDPPKMSAKCEFEYSFLGGNSRHSE